MALITYVTQIRRLAAWLALPIVLGVAACGGTAAPKADPHAFVSIDIAEPAHLIPSATNDISGSQVLAALFAPLVDYDEANKPYEVAADSITSADNTVWTIKLKPGWTFHNGEPVNADSYLNAWAYASHAPSKQDNASFFEHVSALRKVDELTFAVTLDQPFLDFRTELGYTAFYPLPKAAFVDPAANPLVLKQDYENAPIGNGPFKMKGAWQHGSKVEVQRFDGYRGSEKPKVAGITFKIYHDAQAAYSDLLAHKLDVIRAIPADRLSTAARDLGERFQRSPAARFDFLAFPLYRPEFQNPNVRKAISMAIDRQDLAQRVFDGAARPADSFVPPVVAGYRAGTCGESCGFDAADAKRLYASAGGPPSLTITYNADGPHQHWVEATCAQLHAVLDVACLASPVATFGDLQAKALNKELTGMFRLGWSFDYPSMQNYLAPLYSTTGGSNYYGYSNRQFDTLVEQGETASTLDDAIKKWRACEDILARDLPIVPVRFEQNNFGHSSKVRNVQLDLYRRVNLLKLESIR